MRVRGLPPLIAPTCNLSHIDKNSLLVAFSDFNGLDHHNNGGRRGAVQVGSGHDHFYEA